MNRYSHHKARSLHARNHVAHFLFRSKVETHKMSKSRKTGGENNMGVEARVSFLRRVYHEAGLEVKERTADGTNNPDHDALAPFRRIQARAGELLRQAERRYSIGAHRPDVVMQYEGTQGMRMHHTKHVSGTHSLGNNGHERRGTLRKDQSL